MRVLFTISMLALIALLWASISIARHIYRARQRHRNSNKGAAYNIGPRDTQKK